MMPRYTGTAGPTPARGTVAEMDAPALHPDLEPIVFLLGTWVGEGEGDWPSSGPFRYAEEMSFEQMGEPFLLYAQRSWADGGEPLHFERGFVRPTGAGRVEFVLAHPLGIVEVAEGSVSANTIDVASTTVAITETGSPVTELRRRFELEDNVLRYELQMAMRDVPLTRHLKGELWRVMPAMER
jgi:hypothetical protein